MIEVSNSMYQSSASHNSKIELTEYQIETINKLYKLNNVKELNLYDLSVKEMEEEIDDCNDEILEYSNRSSSTFFEKNDDVFDRVKEKIYKDIKLERIEADLKAGKGVKLDAETIISENKTNRVFEFLKLVLIKGLISDDYQNYVSLVYDNTPIEENDNVFIENVYNSKGNDYDLELYDVKRICNILGNKIYNCKNAFNKYILMYLSKNKVELKKYIKSNKDNIFYVYTTIIKDIEIFNRIAETCFEVNYDNQCTYIFKDNDNIRRKDWLIVLGQIKPNIFNKQKDINRLKDEFSKLSLISFHNLKNERVDNLITNMKKISVKFKNLSLVNKNQYLKNLLIDNDLYEVNYINLKQINASLSYKQLCEYECVKDYINENIDRYLSILCDYKIITIENSEFYEYIIKKCNNKNDLVRYIIMNNVVLNDYKVVDDDKIALALCTSNISNVLPILKSELISNECKYQLLKKLPLEYVFDNKEDLKTIINKFQLYDTKIFIKKPVSILLDQLDKNSADDVKFVSNILENCDDKLTKNLLSKLKINENKEFLILDINKLNEMICNYLEKNKLYEYDIMESEKNGKVYKLKKIIENKSEIIEI